MLKIPINTVASALQPTRGKADNVLRRFLVPSMSQLEISSSRGNNCRYSYHSFSQQNSEVSTEKQMTLPPNLMFDFKSSFAPQKDEIAPVLEEADEESESSDEASEYDFDDEEIEEALVFRANPTNLSTHRPVQPLPFRLQVPIHDCLAEEEVGTVWLEASVFGVEDIRVDLIAQNVNYIRNKIRGVRKAKSKTISEKSGSGRKVRNQKGGGVARAGHSRPAHWRGGAKAHGPKNTKDYGNTKLNKRVKALAMRSMLSQKLKEGNLVVVNHLNLDSHKTGPWASILENRFGVGKALKKTRLRSNPELEQTTSALVLDHYLEPREEGEDDYHASYHGVPINLWVASSNIPRVTARNHRFLNVYDCLLNEKLIVTLSALEQIEEKWKE
mmetsp:Transcript_6829/g.14056  ORF Transcript_6829/g.14056 Transcript_6829/m.14056 type:complete len:386 (-) Transcript_6829:114-1271(-)